ncbi:MAG TPA: hypothetical protein VJI74_03005 [Candidatus Paceibacterota bacterium]
MSNLKQTSEGRPLKPKSIFIGIQRALLPSRAALAEHLCSRVEVFIPVRFCRHWEVLRGTVDEIRMFSDGILVIVKKQHEKSVVKNWPCAPVWIPNRGSAGILATWT